MFTRHKLSMTMRHFILLELIMFINHPSNSSLQTTLTSHQKNLRNPKRWHPLYSGTNEVKHTKAISHCSAKLSFFFLETQVAPQISRTTQTFIFHNHKDWIFNLDSFLFLFLIPRCWHKTTKEKSWAAKMFSSGTSWVVWEWHQCSPGWAMTDVSAGLFCIFRCHGLIRSHF